MVSAFRRECLRPAGAATLVSIGLLLVLTACSEPSPKRGCHTLPTLVVDSRSGR